MTKIVVNNTFNHKNTVNEFIIDRVFVHIKLKISKRSLVSDN